MIGYSRIAIGAVVLMIGAPLGAVAQQASPEKYKSPMPPEGAPGGVPLGHVAGTVGQHLSFDVPNPLQGQQNAVREGKQIFIAMNCAGCHGYGATGGMGPNLTDKYWRYGGTPVQVFNSIFQGRPKGMPAWGLLLPSDEIWKVVAYIESLGGTFPADFYHQAMQGNRKGELKAPELAAEEPPRQQRPSNTQPTNE